MKKQTLSFAIMADGKEAAFEDYFIEKGWNVLAIDLTASGQSEGKGAGGLDQSAFDVEAALKYVHLSSSLNPMNLFLLGYSWGAYGVVASLNFDQTPKAVASLAGFRSPDLEMVDKAVRYVGPAAYATKGFMDQALYLSRGNNGFLSAIDGINKAANTKIFIAQGGKDKTVTSFSSIYAARAEINDQSRVSLYYAPERSHGKRLGEEISDPLLQNSPTKGYDHGFIFDSGDEAKHKAILSNEHYLMEVFTDAPAVQVYSDNYPRLNMPLTNGHKEGPHSGITLECVDIPGDFEGGMLVSPKKPYKRFAEFVFAKKEKHQ